MSFGRLFEEACLSSTLQAVELSSMNVLSNSVLESLQAFVLSFVPPSMTFREVWPCDQVETSGDHCGSRVMRP